MAVLKSFARFGNRVAAVGLLVKYGSVPNGGRFRIANLDPFL